MAHFDGKPTSIDVHCYVTDPVEKRLREEEFMKSTD
jgi:hypothetical protein